MLPLKDYNNTKSLRAGESHSVRFSWKTDSKTYHIPCPDAEQELCLNLRPPTKHGVGVTDRVPPALPSRYILS